MAVYTEVQAQDVVEFLQNFSIGEYINHIAIEEGVENSNFLLITTTGKFILTLYEKRVKSDDLPFYLGLLEHVSQAGINCPRPILSKKNLACLQLCGRSAAIFSFLEGSSLVLSNVTPQHLYQLGEILAKLHLSSKNFSLTKDNDLGWDSWQPLWEDIKLSLGNFSQFDNWVPVIEEELLFIKNTWPDLLNLPKAIIHADLFIDNVFFKDDKLVGVIDFYFACEDLLVYDLAICLNAWCFDQNINLNIDYFRAILQGYEQHRKLSEAERAAIMICARGAALRFALTRLYDWIHTEEGSFVVKKDPVEYLRRLNQLKAPNMANLFS